MDGNGHGQRLRELREERGLSLRELSRKADLAPASLSAIEKDQSSPTLATMHKLLKALGTDFITFFSNQEPPPRAYGFSRAAMREIQDPHRKYVLLFPKRDDLRFELMDEQILPTEEEGEWETHDFDLGGMVLAGGPLRLEVEGEGQCLLEEGDAFYVKSGRRHRGSNLGKTPLRLITVADPPRY